jgi:hypothetical protein
MSKKLVNYLIILGMPFIIMGCSQQQTPQPESSVKNDNKIEDKTNTEKASVVYLSYSGTATDDGNITGKNTSEEFHLFIKNDVKNIVYVISRFNYGLWSSKKLIPAELKPMIQTYKADIASSKKLESADKTVEYHEITSLNSIVETEEID